MVSLDVQGVREARKVLREYQRQLQRELKDATEDEANEMLRNVRVESPVDQGDYLAGWRIREQGPRGRGAKVRVKVARWVIENTTRHAVFLERRLGILSRETERAGRRMKRRLKRARDEASRRAERFARRR